MYVLFCNLISLRETIETLMNQVITKGMCDL